MVNHSNNVVSQEVDSYRDHSDKFVVVRNKN